VSSDISVVIATIPPRVKLLRRAAWSVLEQTLRPDAIVIESDPDHTGAAATKNRGLAKVTSEWVAFLDDDDQFLPEHLAKLRTHAFRTDADVVYSIPTVPGSNFVATEPMYGRPFDAGVLRQRSYIQTTSLVRTKLIQNAGGFQCPPRSDYDDWGCWLALLDAGARFSHLPESTFIWNHWGTGTPGRDGNTSGRADRW
jgi:glycosyltransferase involved in cell wall biosynthesis